MATETTTLIGPSEMSRRLDVKAGTVRKWAREGKIPSVRISSKVVRFDASDVMETIRNNDAKQA